MCAFSPLQPEQTQNVCNFVSLAKKAPPCMGFLFLSPPTLGTGRARHPALTALLGSTIASGGGRQRELRGSHPAVTLGSRAARQPGPLSSAPLGEREVNASSLWATKCGASLLQRLSQYPNPHTVPCSPPVSSNQNASIKHPAQAPGPVTALDSKGGVDRGGGLVSPPW